MQPLYLGTFIKLSTLMPVITINRKTSVSYQTLGFVLQSCVFGVLLEWIHSLLRSLSIKMAPPGPQFLVVCCDQRGGVEDHRSDPDVSW